MQKITLSILGIAAILGLLLWGGSAASTKDRAPRDNGAAAIRTFSAPETFFDFGTVSMKNGTVSHTFTVKNARERSATIRTVTASCMCTKAFLVNGDTRSGPFGMPGHGFVPPANEVVPAGGTLGIEVVFDPAAHGPAGVGRIERAVFIEDEAGGQTVITIKALVTP